MPSSVVTWMRLPPGYGWRKSKPEVKVGWDEKSQPMLYLPKKEGKDLFRNLFEKREPIIYKMMPVNEDGKYCQLEFQKKNIQRKPGVGMDGYEYSYNGRKYKDMDTLTAKILEELAGDSRLWQDEYGEYVISTYMRVPTFDSGDREWCSYLRGFLFFDGKKIHLLEVEGGYKIATLTFYENLKAADGSLKPLFERLGWPTEKICWL